MPPWIVRAPGTPYFATEHGEPWTPIGQNDSVAWVEFAGLHGRRDLGAVERHLSWLAAHGVTVLRLMLEYAEDDAFFLEHPAGVWNPAMVQLWDDLFSLCAGIGMRILLTPVDSFFMWNRWDRHPWNTANGGPCPSRTQLLTHPGARAAMKARLSFATARWGGGGVIFAWDIYNEMHPVQGEDRAPECFRDYIDDIAPWLRALETRLHGRAHLQCVSVYGPELIWKPWIREPIFRNGNLDFTNSHFYEEGTIDDPQDTVAPAIGVGRLVREALAEIDDGRPFFDSEHGPIHTFKDHATTLPEAFDDEYFRHIQWAHLASGGAGGGMRWPNRHPHQLTMGMREAQRAMADFLPLIDWASFRRVPIDIGTPADIAAFACGDAHQALVWLLRRGPFLEDGRLAQTPAAARIEVPGLADARYDVVLWDTKRGRVTCFPPPLAGRAGGGVQDTGSLSGQTTPSAEPLARPLPPAEGGRNSRNGRLTLDLPPFAGDIAIAIRSAHPSPGA